MSSLPSSLLTQRGVMIVLSSPSGAGKTTVSQKLLALEKKIRLSVSVTTRPPRASEKEGKDYYFVDKVTFDKMAEEHLFLEHAFVYGHDYGTPRADVQKRLEEGTDVLFDIDWQGTQTLKHSAMSNLVSIFLLPPSLQVLRNRLERRGEDDERVITSRMDKAADELSHWAEYDYVVVNDDLEKTVKAVQSIIHSERLKRHRQGGLMEFVNTLRAEKPRAGEK